MPAIDANSNRPTKVRAKPPKAKKRTADRRTRVVVVRPPDRADDRATVRAQQLERSTPKTPDQADRKRAPAQKARDATVVAGNVRSSRLKVTNARNRGSGLAAIAKTYRAVMNAGLNATSTKASDRLEENSRSRGKGGGGGPMFAAIQARLAANTPVVRDAMRVKGPAGKLAANAVADVGELAVTTPTSMAKLAATAVTDPKKVPGMLVEPYKELAKDPVGVFTERPVSTALMLQPAVRMPGRAAGRVARVTGKQTLERPDATLPGTSLREKRTGSRDLVVRAAQSRKDNKNPAPTVTAKDLQRRVDEHHDLSKQRTARAERAANAESRKATKGQPRAERDEHAAAAREQARDQAARENDQRFAREFGANARLATGATERDAAAAARGGALTRVEQARQTVRAADEAHERAFSEARVARARASRSPTLAALETRRRDAGTALARAQRAAGGRGVAGPRGAKRRGERAQRIRDARATVRDLDRQISAERERIKGVPPAEHQQLVRAIDDRAEARAELAAARTEREITRVAHIDTKQAMRAAPLVDHAPEGRTYTHEADARAVADRLNQAGNRLDLGPDTARRRVTAASTRGKLPGRFTVHDEGAVSYTPGHGTTPLEFTVRAVGDEFAVVPKIVQTRLIQHDAVGSSKALPAKVMKRSRGAFTQAVLPLSLKWLAGQGVEAGVRSLVAGAGPFDLLRVNKVVKELNKERPGAGDELLQRISGGQFELTGAARDFARGKSLAEEFAGTKLEQPAAATTLAANTKPMRAVRAGWRRYTDTVVGGVNHIFENTARKAMAGQALKNGPFMERRITALSDQAIQDAARGLRGTEAQVELARAVDRMYGKYQKFGPDMRSFLLHWSPFMPWYLNVVTFLTKTLPVDHPIQAALIADTSAATEEWRKTAGLSLRHGEGGVPDFLLGRYPGADGKLFPISKYTPFGIGSDVGGATASLMLPQFMGPVKNMAGVDWKWQTLKHPGYAGEKFNIGERALRALTSAGESQIPGVSQVGRLSGVTARYVDKKDPVEIPPFRTRLERELPWTPTGGNTTGREAKKSRGGVRVKPVQVKPVQVKPIRVKPIKAR